VTAPNVLVQANYIVYMHIDVLPHLDAHECMRLGARSGIRQSRHNDLPCIRDRLPSCLVLVPLRIVSGQGPRRVSAATGYTCMEG
jgi:hypothetical protein